MSRSLLHSGGVFRTFRVVAGPFSIEWKTLELLTSSRSSILKRHLLLFEISFLSLLPLIGVDTMSASAEYRLVKFDHKTAQLNDLRISGRRSKIIKAFLRFVTSLNNYDDDHYYNIHIRLPIMEWTHIL